MRELLAAVLLVSAAVLLAVGSRDGPAKTRLDIGRCVERRQWQQALAKAREMPPQLYDAFVMHDVNRALFHVGRLPDDMFSFPQKQVVSSAHVDRFVDGLFLYTRRHQLMHQTCLRSSALFCELGQLNLAERTTLQAVEIFGERPELLWRLVRLRLAAHDVPMARCFLGRLGMNPLHRRTADDYLRRLDVDPDMKDDPEVARLRSLRIAVDRGPRDLEYLTDRERMLLELLETNPNNRMAFEYLMAHYLLLKQVDQVYANLWQLDRFDYPAGRLPRHYEEAVLVHMKKQRLDSVELHGRHIRPETCERFDAFLRAVGEWYEAPPGRRETIETALADTFGDTYYFYDLFGYTVAWAEPSFVDAVTGATR